VPQYNSLDKFNQLSLLNGKATKQIKYTVHQRVINAHTYYIHVFQIDHLPLD